MKSSTLLHARSESSAALSQMEPRPPWALPVPEQQRIHITREQSGWTLLST